MVVLKNFTANILSVEMRSQLAEEVMRWWEGLQAV